MGEGSALGVAGAVLALVVAGWWAARERPGGDGSGAAERLTGPSWQRIASRPDLMFTTARQGEHGVCPGAEPAALGGGYCCQSKVTEE